jgi:dihydrofolate reductase
MSLDGYAAAPDGGVGWLDPYADARARFTPFIKTIGSAVMGRATWDFAVRAGYADFGGMPCYVVTHRPFAPASPGVTPWSGPLPRLVQQVRKRHPRDIWLMGGGNLAKQFLDADLIDIWSIAVVPALLGAGLSMFPPTSFAERRLALVGTTTSSSGVVELRYERRSGRKRLG